VYRFPYLNRKTYQNGSTLKLSLSLVQIEQCPVSFQGSLQCSIEQASQMHQCNILLYKAVMIASSCCRMPVNSSAVLGISRICFIVWIYGYDSPSRTINGCRHHGVCRLLGQNRCPDKSNKMMLKRNTIVTYK